jgi:hypothetical protein
VFLDQVHAAMLGVPSTLVKAYLTP